MGDNDVVDEAPSGTSRVPRGTLQGLADIQITETVGLNLRILLEPIGFLRISLIVLTLFAFALTAGYSSNGDSNQASCQKNLTNITIKVILKFEYPYRETSYVVSYEPEIPDSSEDCTIVERQLFSGSAEYFVAISSISFVFGILTIPFYIIFYVPRYDLAKYLSIIDLIITALLTFFYFLADIAWSAGIYSLNSFHEQTLRDKRDICLNCTTGTEQSPDIQNSVQISFSVLFGWVATLVLIASLWFTYKDTIVHLDRLGPLYRIPLLQRNKGKEQSYEPDEKGQTQTQSQERREEDLGRPPPDSDEEDL